MPRARRHAADPGPVRPWDVFARGRAVLDALEHLAGGLGTVVLALVVLLWLAVVAVTCLVGVGLLLVPAALRALRAVADRERARLSRWGPEVIGPEPARRRLRAALADPTARRELRWLVGHGTLGLLLGLIGLTLPLIAVQRRHVPAVVVAAAAGGGHAVRRGARGPCTTWPGALAVGLLGLGWLAVVVGLGTGHGPAAGVARGAGCWRPPRGPTSSLRVAQLTATRAAALDAHATELRRIERSLHDGTQNRLVAVTVLLGAARRARGPRPGRRRRHPRTGPERRRAGARRAAHASPAASCRRCWPTGGWPTRSPAWPPTARCPAGSTSTYPAGAPPPSRPPPTSWWPRRSPTSPSTAAPEHATVTVRRHGGRLLLRVTDDGRGGADEHGGSGLVGIRRRIEAHDGTLVLTSPPGGPTTLEVEPAMRIVIAEDDPLLREGLALLLRAESLDVVATTGTPDGVPGRRRRPRARRRHRRRPDAADPHRRGDRRGRRGPAPPARPGRPRAVRLRRAGLRHRSARRRQRPARLPAQGTGRPGRGVPGPRCTGWRTAAPPSTPRSSRSSSPAPGPDTRLDRLSPRERDVLALMAEGLGNTAIAERLFVTEGAVHKHIRSIFAKLDLAPDRPRRPARGRRAALPGGRPAPGLKPTAVVGSVPSHGPSKRSEGSMSGTHRSRQWYAGDTRDAFIHRAWMRRGLPDHAFDGRPQIVICNTWSDLTPCNGALPRDRRARQARRVGGGRGAAGAPGAVAGRDPAAPDRHVLPRPRRHGRRGAHPGQPGRRGRAARRVRQDRAVAADGRGVGGPAHAHGHRRPHAQRPLRRQARWAAAPGCGR